MIGAAEGSLGKPAEAPSPPGSPSAHPTPALLANAQGGIVPTDGSNMTVVDFPINPLAVGSAYTPSYAT
jgi:hypothetical protein